MAYFKSPAWRDLIETFEFWFYEATSYVNDYGDYRPRGFYPLTIELLDGLIDVAHLDPMPAWDVFRMIRSRCEPNPYSEKRLIPLGEIEERLEQVQMYYDRVTRVGITATKQGAEAVEITSTNEERDSWMYSRKDAGDTHAMIRMALSTEHKEWDQLDTEQSVGRAIDRYALRHNKPLIRRKRQ